MYLCERDLLWGFYAIRKLIESQKLCTETVRLQLSIHAYPTNDSGITWFNWRDLDRHFRLDARQSESRSLAFTANQFIHSYVFAPYTDEAGGLGGVFVASDKMLKNRVYQVELSTIVTCFERVGLDSPNKLIAKRNSVTGDWVIEQDSETDTD